MQKFNIYLGHPNFSICVVLFSILFFSGVGSLATSKIPVGGDSIIKISITAIILISMIYIVLLDVVFNGTFSWGLYKRISIAILLIAPVAFFMGMPFPMGIKLIQKHTFSFVPWAWGIKGATSVLGSIGCIFLSMQVGFQNTMIIGGCFYFLGLTAVIFTKCFNVD